MTVSFTALQKQALIKAQYKNSCCRRAILMGVLAAKAEIIGERECTVNLAAEEHAEFISRLVSEFYGQIPEKIKSTGGGRGKTFKIASPALVKYLKSISEGAPYFTEKCSLCQASFLRGYFLAAGRICDPKKQYLLEFSPHNEPKRFLQFLAALDIDARYNKRKNEDVIYVKKSAIIEDFFTLASMTSTVFEIMNAKIENEIRNDSNRKRNCDTHNIDKSIEASREKINVISRLAEHKLLSSLPEDLEKTARLRLENPEMSLTNLARISRPPLSKSGLVHRLNRIIEIGSQLLK